MLIRILILLSVAAAAYIFKKIYYGNKKEDGLLLPGKYKINDRAIPTLVYFWTDQCSQCKFFQKPVIQKLSEKEKGFNLVSVNAFEDTEITSLLKIRTVPSTAVFSSEGKSRFVNNGPVGEHELLRQLNES